MKRIALFLLPLSLFSFELNFSKTFEKEIMPDTLSTSIIIRVDSQNERHISKVLEKYNEIIKDNDEVEKRRGSLTIRPHYKYSSKNIPKIISYIGQLTYKVNSTSAYKIDKFINEISRINKERSTSITISSLKWSVKSETVQIANDIIRLEATQWALTYTRNLESDLRKKCKLEKVSLNSNRVNYMPRMLSHSAQVTKSFSKAVVPEVNGQKISSIVNISIECKI